MLRKASGSGENRREGDSQIRVQEAVAKLLQLSRNNALAGQQERVGHFSEHQPQRKRRSREKRRTVQRTRKLPCKFRVAHRARSHDIYRALNRTALQREAQNLDDIFQRHPRHPLLPRSDSPAHAKLERQFIFASAPPCCERMIPNRARTTRIPRASAFTASASHSCARLARKSFPAALSSVSNSSPRLP